MIKPKVILLFGSTKSDRRKKELEGFLEKDHVEAPPIIGIYQPQRFVHSGYMKDKYDSAGREAVKEFKELETWLRGVKGFKTRGTAFSARPSARSTSSSSSIESRTATLDPVSREVARARKAPSAKRCPSAVCRSSRAQQ